MKRLITLLVLVLTCSLAPAQELPAGATLTLTTADGQTIGLGSFDGDDLSFELFEGFSGDVTLTIVTPSGVLITLTGTIDDNGELSLEGPADVRRTMTDLLPEQARDDIGGDDVEDEPEEELGDELDDDDARRGPPDNVGERGNGRGPPDNVGEPRDEGRGPPDDRGDRRGPPDHAGGDGGDDDSDDND